MLQLMFALVHNSLQKQMHTDTSSGTFWEVAELEMMRERRMEQRKVVGCLPAQREALSMRASCTSARALHQGWALLGGT